MQASEDCKNLIKEFESLRLSPYKCPAGIPTIGWGSTRYPDGKKIQMTDSKITKEAADAIFEWHIEEFEITVSRLLCRRATQGQFDAMVSLCFNIGGKLFGTSTLLKKFNGGDFVGAANEFLRWTKSNGKVLPGLVRRRSREKEMFEGVNA